MISPKLEFGYRVCCPLSTSLGPHGKDGLAERFLTVFMPPRQPRWLREYVCGCRAQAFFMMDSDGPAEGLVSIFEKAHRAVMRREDCLR